MSAFKPVRDAYADWAPHYDTDVNRTRDLDAALLRRADLPLDGATVVEIGAGTGKNTAYLATRAAEVIGFDVSEAMLGLARRRALGPHVTFILHDAAEPWPVADGSVDVVVGNLVLEHIADLDRVFAQARRVLRPGGHLYWAELHPYRQWRGGGAHYAGKAGEVRVEAYVHTTAAYVGAGLRAGFRLTGLVEAGDEDASQQEASPLPRILQLTFAAPEISASARPAM